MTFDDEEEAVKAITFLPRLLTDDLILAQLHDLRSKICERIHSRRSCPHIRLPCRANPSIRSLRAAAPP